ncbi:MAG TPA: alpha/beta hydrolase-fold protein [Lacibacter sp.]|nr:alpha/beta hydrolase-fold protein [Lacibacter sp.]
MIRTNTWKRTIFLLLFLSSYGVVLIQAQHVVRFEIITRPQSHRNESLYIAGSFNNWNPSLPLYRFINDSTGKEYLELKNVPQGIFEYKVTRGSWQSSESTAAGTALTNRIIKINRDTVVAISIAGWVDDFPSRPPVTTKSKNVFLVDSAFFIPQLERTRRIWIYLPETYATTQKRFPVIYMQDGQNLFDVLTAPYGEWGVDEMMDTVRTGKQCIIVGIDHGGPTRLTEYNPYTSRFGKGEGDAYVEFIVQRLKPYIDSVFRTKPQREFTSIAGSSMGGLISFYAALKYPEVFGGAGVFSPSFWLTPDLKQNISSNNSKYKPAFYFVCGELESESMITDMKDIAAAVIKSGNRKVFIKTVTEGRHNEQFWKNEMYECLLWLQKNQMR